MSNNPLVSVFIPYYNDKDFLKESIESVLNQTYKNFELVLLNHASTDCSRDIAHSYDDERIKHIDMPYNLGYGGSGLLLKEFLKVAKGNYVKLFCADDVMIQNGLENLVNYMEQHSNVDFAFGDVEYIDKKGEALEDNWFKSRKFFDINDKEIECIRKLSELKGVLPYVGSIIKREILFNITINTTFVMMFDMSLWLELLCAEYKMGFLDKIVGKYRIHPKQLSATDNYLESSYLTTFEVSSFWHIFQKIQNVETAKKVFCDSKYVDMLKEKEDIPFFVAQALLKNSNFFITTYSYLTDLLNNDESRIYLQKTFNYGVKELRRDSMSKYTFKRKLGEKKNKIYMKQVGELSFKDIILLLVHKIYFFVTFHLIKKRRNKSL